MKKRLNIKNILLTAAGLMLLSIALTGCSQNTAAIVETDNSTLTESASDQGDTHRVIHLEGGDTGYPNPFRHTSRGPGIAKMQLLYDSLLEKDEKGLIPWLAKSWETSGDGTVYTFHLQNNAKWHDGKPLTAEDAAFTFSYYKDHPPVSNDLLVDGEYIVTEAKALDDQTLQVTFSHFDLTFLEKAGSVRILPKHIWSEVQDPAAYDGDEAAVGSGPYRLESYNPEQGAYRYQAFNDYWGFKPAAEAIEWIPVSDRVLAFENREIDLINASADLLTRYDNDKAYTLKSSPSYHSYRLMINMETEPLLKDKNIRQAMAYGIDRQELVEKVARGAGTVSSMGYIPVYSQWYNPQIQQYNYNVNKAKELLGGHTYSFQLLTDNSQEGVKTAELIKLSLEKIGITVTLQSAESKTRDHALKTGDYQLLLINSGGMGGDPDYIRTVYGSGSETIKGWSDETIEDLAARQAVQTDESLRKDLLGQLQERIAEEVPIIMLYGTTDNYVYRSNNYNGWMFRYDHSKCDHNKLSYLIRE